MTKRSEVITRRTGHVAVTVEWPNDWADWDRLPRGVRNRIRDLMDAIADTRINQRAKELLA